MAVGDEPFYLIKKTYLSTLVEETYFKTSFIKKKHLKKVKLLISTLTIKYKLTHLID